MIMKHLCQSQRLSQLKQTVTLACPHTEKHRHKNTKGHQKQQTYLLHLGTSSNINIYVYKTHL